LEDETMLLGMRFGYGVKRARGWRPQKLEPGRPVWKGGGVEMIVVWNFLL
jgi:hypothetical protein